MENNISNTANEREPRIKALIPFGVFIVFYLGLSIWQGNFSFVPMPIAFVVASATAFLLNRKMKFADKVDIYAKGMGNSNIMIMCLIFILAGAFGTTAKSMGAVDASVIISRHFVPDSLILVGFFTVSCFISLAIGTSCGTIATLTPIAMGMVKEVGVAPEIILGAVIGGAMFGDNMSMISDTTIAATRTQEVSMRDKFLMNIKMIFPAAVITVLIYYFVGKKTTVDVENVKATWKHAVAIVPYIFILIAALDGLNVMVVLFLGTVMAMAIGIISGNMTFQEALADTGTGTLGMAETLIVAILAGGLLNLIRHNGGIGYIILKIEKAIHCKRDCEIGIAVLVSLINLFTANNTVAIVVAGPIAKMLSEKYKCDSKRIASILDTASCVVQGMIPYGAQILIAIGVAKAANVEIDSIKLILSLYYPMLLGGVLIVSILVGRKRKEDVCPQ